jgi:hypothetical protein
MEFRRLSLGAGLAVPLLLAFTGSGAGAKAGTHTTAVNGHQPAKSVTAIDDGDPLSFGNPSGLTG